jgi:hypothetical protein
VARAGRVVAAARVKQALSLQTLKQSGELLSLIAT